MYNYISCNIPFENLVGVDGGIRFGSIGKALGGFRRSGSRRGGFGTSKYVAPRRSGTRSRWASARNSFRRQSSRSVGSRASPARFGKVGRAYGRRKSPSASAARAQNGKGSKWDSMRSKGNRPPGMKTVTAADNKNAKKIQEPSNTGKPKDLTREEKKKVENSWTKPQPQSGKPADTPHEKEKKNSFLSRLKSDRCGMDCALQGAGLALQVGDFIRFGLEQKFANDRMLAEKQLYEKKRLDAIKDKETYSDNGKKPTNRKF